MDSKHFDVKFETNTHGRIEFLFKQKVSVLVPFKDCVWHQDWVLSSTDLDIEEKWWCISIFDNKSILSILLVDVNSKRVGIRITFNLSNNNFNALEYLFRFNFQMLLHSTSLNLHRCLMFIWRPYNIKIQLIKYLFGMMNPFDRWFSYQCCLELKFLALSFDSAITFISEDVVIVNCLLEILSVLIHLDEVEIF
jgi:hypothetical protein